ncbi:hypothetical protein BH20ACT2_BH20ACT2_24590 [soil metagenome]
MRLARTAAAMAVAGATLVGAAWAGIGLAPMGTEHAGAPAEREGLAAATGSALDAVQSLVGQESRSSAGGPVAPDLSGLRPLPDGEFLVGGAVTSLAPDPARWQTEGCSENLSNFPEEITHLAGLVVEGQFPGWPRSPDCVYLGGYGLGPARAATGVDPHAGVNVRSLAISNGEETLVWQTVDMVGYFNLYRPELCDGCGILEIRRRMAAATGMPIEHLAIGSTHTHGGADGYGAWGGLPGWYREQIAEQIEHSAYDALRAMRPAALTIGSVEAPAFSNERRDTYYSAADYGAVWMQAEARPDGRSQRPGTAPEVIATLVNYAAHPVVLGPQSLMHGDWPATASKALADRFGGTAMIVEGGLGNVSPRRPQEREVDLTGDGTYDDYDKVIEMGADFAGFIAADIARGGHRILGNDIAAVGTTIEHPVTNAVELLLGVGGLLDRAFLPGEGAGLAGSYTWSKGDEAGVLRSCVATSSNTIKTQVSAYRIGELTMVTGPGELFSTMTNVVKSRGGRRHQVDGGQVMAFAQTQDSLGYLIQSFEVDPLGGPTSATGATEYEETFMLDRCFGDHVLETQLELLDQLG